MTPVRISYGDHPEQYGELWLPAETPRPGVIVVIHGGFWRARYNAALGRPPAADLAARGWVAWNIEYRRAGNGGGWPATFEDVSAAVDRLATLDVNTSRVVTLGHSAGGHLAVWLAGRDAAAVPVTGAVSQAGVVDLLAAVHTHQGNGAVVDFLGVEPQDAPEVYAAADPMQRLPIGVPVICVHAPGDDEVMFAQSEAYVVAATAAGDDARLVRASGDHYTLIHTDTADWTLCVDAVESLAAGHAARPGGSGARLR